MQEKEIIEVAVDQFNKQTGLGATLTFSEQNASKQIDGELQLLINNTEYHIVCKKWITKTNLQRQIATLKLENILYKIILITDYLPLSLAEQLKEHDIQFLDAAGNAFISKRPVYIHIQGKKPNKPHKDIALVKQVGKAFQPKGMKVIFMLLTQPKLVNETMRTIADHAEVALGTVKQVMDDLIYQGFIINKGNKRKVVKNRKTLLEKWLDAYPANMEAKLNQALFATDNPEQLKALDIGKYNGLWGGEVAAERYDHYLKAKDILIYLTPEKKQTFLKTARLRKPAAYEVPDYKVIIADPPFEINKIQGDLTDLAHPLLVYANLVTSTDPRNMDAAKRLYDEYLT